MVDDILVFNAFNTLKRDRRSTFEARTIRARFTNVTMDIYVVYTCLNLGRGRFLYAPFQIKPKARNAGPRSVEFRSANRIRHFYGDPYART